MTYIKLDDGFPKHPKVIGLSRLAKWLYVEGLCYASRYLTDGVIPSAALRDLGAKQALIDELAGVELWEPHERGWMIHDYLGHQRSRDQIDQQRNATRSRVKRHRNAVSNAPVTTHRDRDIEAEAETKGQSDDRAARDWFVMATAREPDAITVEVLAGIDFAHTPECIRWAFESSEGAENRWRYAKSILDSCTLEGHGPREKQRGSRSNGVRQGAKRGAAEEGGARGSGDPSRYRW